MKTCCKSNKSKTKWGIVSIVNLKFKNRLILDQIKYTILRMGKIEIEGMEFYAYHGHFAEEQIVGNRFIVNLTLFTDCTKASESDDLADALDYQMAYRIVKEEMLIKSHLLENVAGRILARLFNSSKSIERAIVKISKLNPPLGGQIERVSVTLER